MTIDTNEIRWLLDEKYNGVESEAFYHDIKRLNQGEPLGYVLGYVPFLNTTIWLDSHPLIPRVETEYWTETLINCLKNKNKHIKVLDMCAGSGCIGVAILKNIPNTEIDFVEIEQRHHKTIQKNLKKNIQFTPYFNIYGGSLFEQVSNTSKYDIIVANPPYIDPKLDRTEISVRSYEPPEALYGGKNGFELIREILISIKKYLSPEGILCIEHEPEHVNAINKTAKQNGLKATTMDDQYNCPRYSIINVAQY